MSVYKSLTYFLVLSRENKHFCHTLVLKTTIIFISFLVLCPPVNLSQIVVQVSSHHERKEVILNVQVHIRTLHCTKNEVFH